MINTLSRSNGVFESKQLDVDGWKALYGKDTNSKITSRQISPFTIEQVTGTNKFTNGAFNSNIGGLYAFSPASNCITGFNNGALDGGTLQVSFPNISGNANNKGSVIIGIGNIKAGKQYLLRSLAAVRQRVVRKPSLCGLAGRRSNQRKRLVLVKLALRTDAAVSITA